MKLDFDTYMVWENAAVEEWRRYIDDPCSPHEDLFRLAFIAGFQAAKQYYQDEAK